MMKEVIKPKGEMILSLLDDDGVEERWHVANRVLPTGREALLHFLAGNWRQTKLSTILLSNKFAPEQHLKEFAEFQVPVKGVTATKPALNDGVLNLSFRATANAEAVVAGGGVLISALNAKEEEVTGLYNFAPLKEPVQVEPDQPLSIKFNLSFE